MRLLHEFGELVPLMGLLLLRPKKVKKIKFKLMYRHLHRIGTNPDLEYIMNQAE